MEAFVYARMTEYLENLKNQDVAQSIVEKALRACKVREAARKAKELARAKNQLEPRAGGQAFQLHGQKSGRKRNVHR